MPEIPRTKPGLDIIARCKVNMLTPEIEAFALEGHVLVLRTICMEGEDTFEFDMDQQVKAWEVFKFPWHPHGFFEIVSSDEQLFVATVPEDIAIQMIFELQNSYLDKQGGRRFTQPQPMEGFRRIYRETLSFRMAQKYFGFKVRIDGKETEILFYPESITQVNVYNTYDSRKGIELIDVNGGAITFHMDRAQAHSCATALRAMAKAHNFPYEVIEE